MPSSCSTCFQLTGLQRQHADAEPCPLLQTLFCRRCHTRGHATASCDEPWESWERPTCLEELIPWDVRESWGIDSVTTTEFAEPRGAAGTQRELVVEIEVPREDKPMRAFMDARKLDTTRKTEDNMQRIREWAHKFGYRMVLV